MSTDLQIPLLLYSAVSCDKSVHSHRAGTQLIKRRIHVRYYFHGVGTHFEVRFPAENSHFMSGLIQAMALAQNVIGSLVKMC